MTITNTLNLVKTRDGRFLTEHGAKTEKGILEILNTLSFTIDDDYELGTRTAEILHLLECSGEYHTARGFKRPEGLGAMIRDLIYKHQEEKHE